MSALEVVQIFFIIANKVVVVGIAMWAVWALQTVLLDEEYTSTYPFVRKWPVRLSIALIAAGFAIDALSVYTPAFSEVIMNMGIFILMHLFKYKYKKTNSKAYED